MHEAPRDPLGGGLLRGGVGYGKGDEGDLFDDVEAGAATELVDDGFGETAGVVLDPDGLFRLAQIDTADAVDLAKASDGHGCGFGWGDTVAVEDVKLGHTGMIAAGRGQVAPIAVGGVNGGLCERNEA